MKSKEYMKMMGLRESMYNLSWFLFVTFPILLNSIAFPVGIFALGLVKNASFLLVLLFSLSFGFSLITFCFLAASFCDTTRTSILVGALWLYVVSQP